MIITMCRAIPDLVFAVLFVRALGIGVLPGILALGLHSVGMMAKLFADAIEQIDEGPREAVRATGAGRLARVGQRGACPRSPPAWIGTFIYRVDINLRTSVVLGFVGAGGIGFALQDALRGLMYQSAMGIILIILLIIAAMEYLASGLRRTLLDPASPMEPPCPRCPAPPFRPPWTKGRTSFRGLCAAATVTAVVVSVIYLNIDPLAPIKQFPGPCFRVWEGRCRHRWRVYRTPC